MYSKFWYFDSFYFILCNPAGLKFINYKMKLMFGILIDFQYVGRWYEIENFETGYELEMICITADYGELSEYATGLIKN